MKENIQREFDQSKDYHQEHFKNMENKVNEIAASHEIQNQRSQRDLELKAQELAAKNAALEEELVLKQQSQDERQIAAALFMSQTEDGAIDLDADQDVEQRRNASTQEEELHTASLQQDWTATPREGAASHSSNQPEVTSPVLNAPPTAQMSQESSSPPSIGKQGKRTRGPAK